MSNNEQEFYTVRGYALQNHDDNSLTPSMEDYLEMIYRISRDKGYVRISDLANALNVQPPSATKMANKLAELNYIIYEKYGVVQLTEQGVTLGNYLLKRHEAIEKFLIFIGVTDNLLEETEKIEHNISEKTLKQIMVLLEFMEKNESWLEAFNHYKERKRNSKEVEAK